MRVRRPRGVGTLTGVKKLFRSPASYVLLALLAVVVVGALARSGDKPVKLRLDQFEEQVAAGEVRTATIADRDGTVSGELANGDKYKVNYVRDDSEKLGEILRTAENPPQVRVDHQKDPVWWAILQTFLPVILLILSLIHI